MSRNPDPNQIKQDRLYGWMLFFLYKELPDPVEFAVLWELMDTRNFPLSRRSFAAHLSYLRSKELIRVFPGGTDDELTATAQSKLLQKYAAADDDKELPFTLYAWMTEKGVDFQRGVLRLEGIHRV